MQDEDQSESGKREIESFKRIFNHLVKYLIDRKHSATKNFAGPF